MARRVGGSLCAVFEYNGRSVFTIGTAVMASVNGYDCSCVLCEERLRSGFEEDSEISVFLYNGSTAFGADGMGRA